MTDREEFDPLHDFESAGEGSASDFGPLETSNDLSYPLEHRQHDRVEISSDRQADTFSDSSIGESSLLPQPHNAIDVSNDFYRLDPQSIQVSIIGLVIMAFFLTGGSLIGLIAAFVYLNVGVAFFTIASVTGVFVAAVWIFAFVFPPIEFKYAKWRLDSEGFEIHRGVFWRHRVTVPLGRVQHADVVQGPFQRLFGLGTLVINTAGTQNASITVEGLSHQTAIELRDLIIRQRVNEEVV
ncbi:MAG: PH domain-containing protein [Planctomycetota bacterium]